MREFTGNEVAASYSDQWGIPTAGLLKLRGQKPPNPTGYVPQMSIAELNDQGPIPDQASTRAKMITDPATTRALQQIFATRQPFMPDSPTYMVRRLIPTQAFAEG